LKPASLFLCKTELRVPRKILPTFYPPPPPPVVPYLRPHRFLYWASPVFFTIGYPGVYFLCEIVRVPYLISPHLSRSTPSVFFWVRRHSCIETGFLRQLAKLRVFGVMATSFLERQEWSHSFGGPPYLLPVLIYPSLLRILFALPRKKIQSFLISQDPP